MATADEIQKEIEQKQSEKDALDAKIDKLSNMIIDIEVQEQIVVQKEYLIKEDCNEILKIYNQFEVENIDNSVGYIEDLYLGVIKSERNKFDIINKELIDNIVLVTNKISDARDLYIEWTQESRDLGNQINSLELELFFANLLGG